MKLVIWPDPTHSTQYTHFFNWGYLNKSIDGFKQIWIISINSKYYLDI